MQGWKRKLVYVTAFEGLAILLSMLGFMLASDAGPALSGGLSVLASAVAMVWNLAYNAAFEAWERGQAQRGRPFGRRILHALGFELGLAAVLVPVFAALLGLSLVEAFLLDGGMMLFFLGYTFLFNLGFDRLFGLPASAA
ncbi:MAG: PACE efflux transporter [Amaricoccus sp.]